MKVTQVKHISKSKIIEIKTILTTLIILYTHRVEFNQFSCLYRYVLIGNSLKLG